MKRKMHALAITTALFAAFVVPAKATAERLFEGGSALSPFAKFQLTSSNVRFTNTALGTLECKQWRFAAQLISNVEGGSVFAEGIAGETSECLVGGFAATITEPSMRALLTNAADAGAMELSFVVDLGPFECPYFGEGLFTYETGTDTFHVANSLLVSPLEICESEELPFPTFEGDFTVTTANGTPVVIVSK